MQNKKRFFTILFLTLFVWLFAASFALALEINYPDFGGIQPDAKSVPATIKYIFNAFIVLALLAVIGSLVYGGVLYLTAAGDPSAHGKGKKQLIGSFIGLVILLGSYITLQFVNPELLSLSVQKVPVKSGIILLNESAVLLNLGLLKPEERQQKLNDLMDEIDSTKPQAKPLLSGGIKNITEEFKDGFKPAGAYVYPNSYCQIYTYSTKDFADILNYSYAYPSTNIYYGRSKDSKIIDSADFNGFFTFSEAPKIISIQAIMGAPTGVQLAAVEDDQVTDKKFLYGVGWQQDIVNTDTSKGQIQIKSIALRNWTPEKTATGFTMTPTHDYIAILYQGLSGYLSQTPSNFQIFFEHRQRKKISGGALDTGTGNLPAVNKVFPDGTSNSFFNIPFGAKSIYGSLKTNPMSMQVGEINENGSVDVYLCSMTKVAIPEQSPYCEHFSSAVYEPRNFLDSETVQNLEYPNDPTKQEIIKNNVRSIFIQGKAIVVLFANSVDGANFSENSEVFVSQGSLKINYLANDSGLQHKIMNCDENGIVLDGWNSPCAKGLAIYPIK